MNYHFKNQLSQKKGFTLVEMSIVLIIIGLLIGGILAARSMLKMAQIQAQIKQLQQFDVAVSSFRTTYKQLPGDSNFFGGVGNNDGYVSSSLDGSPSGTPAYTGETTTFWPDLFNGLEFSPEKTFKLTSCSINQRTALATINNQTAVLASYDGSFFSSKFNTYVLYAPGGPDCALDNGSGGSIKAADALAIDKIIDDGLAKSGKVWASQNTYNLSGPYLVMMEIRMLSQAQ